MKRIRVVYWKTQRRKKSPRFGVIVVSRPGWGSCLASGDGARGRLVASGKCALAEEVWGVDRGRQHEVLRFESSCDVKIQFHHAAPRLRVHASQLALTVSCNPLKSLSEPLGFSCTYAGALMRLP